MREPSFPTDAARWAWWEAAVRDGPGPISDGLPQAGFFKVRRWRSGPFAPAVILWEPPAIDPLTGELLAGEVCRATIDGFAVDPWESWTWMAKTPVSLEEWDWLRAISRLSPRRSPSGSRPWWERSARPPR